jgi:hypothetical protein
MPRFLLLLASLLWLQTASALASQCQGTNLVEGLKKLDPAAYRAIEREADATPNGEAILWRIEADGIPPSYLFGTAHVSDSRVTDISNEARAALEAARTVAFELEEVRDKNLLAGAMMKHARFMAMPAGRQLWDLIPDAEEDLIRKNPNLPSDRMPVIGVYQPWVVATMLSVPLCEQQRLQQGHASLDEQLARYAYLDGKRIVGLETVEEQLSVFANMPLDQQADYLVATAKMSMQANDYFETLISQYVARRITTILPLSRQLGEGMDGGAEAFAFVETKLIEKRNRLMFERADDLLKEGGAFIAVGALHLPGKDGLVELIRGSGYKVIPVN